MIHSYRAVLFTITLSIFVSVSSLSSFALTGDIDPSNKTPECISFISNIRYGDSDSVTKGPITKLQSFLIDEGYMKGEATGYFGAVTFASVKRYQTAKGLTDSGYVGEYTRAAIKSDTCAEITKPAVVTQPQATSSAAVFGPTSQASTSVSAGVTGGASFGGSATYVPTVPFQSPVASIDRVNFPCVILLGKNSCTSEVTWSSNWFAPFPQSPELRTCELTSAGSCAAKEETYRGSSGTQSFTLQGGVRRMFSIWGYDFLGKIYKAYEITTKGACATGSSWSGSACVTGGASFGGSATGATGGATFGPGYGSQPVTYGWVAYAGSMLGAQSPENLGWGSPSVPCTASNAGASYYLGVSSSGSQVVATCSASNQAVTDFAPVTPSTLNTQGQTSSGSSQSQTTGSTGGAVFGGSATVTCTESRGTFTNSVGQLVEWSCGCANPPSGGAWVSVGGSCFHQIVQ